MRKLEIGESSIMGNNLVSDSLIPRSPIPDSLTP